ncbi:hypothetical protein [Dongia sedimenti]|uniref:Carboxypeptidase regulatory-like domain-containing protein n=1 Tax=Dongia sedimenti TaxID=3064282 RepID=A0ABU0YGM7_9PROT|nr:hypothetical protein [Rhodospirillaceae bacterium R-7]
MSSSLRRLSPPSLILLGLLSAPLPAAAQGAGDPILDAGGIKYACAGVGKASRADPRWASFPVKLQFAAANGDFLGDPDVTVTDSSGKQVFKAQCNGPWVLIELPAGSYQVHATGQKGQYAKDFPISVKAGAQTSKTIRLP